MATGTDRRHGWDIGRFGAVEACDGAYRVVVFGASSGIGETTAKVLAGHGAVVTCVGRDRRRTEALVRQIDGFGGRARAALGDIADSASVERLLDEAETAFGPLHAAVNCVGILGETTTPLMDAGLEAFEDVIRVNLTGAAILTRTLLRRMVPRGFGRIAHVSSMAGKDGNANMAAYSASKAGLIGLVKSVAKETAKTGVTINALVPALIRTPMMDSMPPETAERLSDMIPMGRAGDAEEVAATIAWMISPACSFTTGFCFDVSGGRATY